mmetsp:Transcript_12402/g.22227  ORF Transcript_12402/g.22227 Transcript_12402/m.22227 type:complete len:103 (+) Transcript_12402:763-1071(+)
MAILMISIMTANQKAEIFFVFGKDRQQTQRTTEMSPYRTGIDGALPDGEPVHWSHGSHPGPVFWIVCHFWTVSCTEPVTPTLFFSVQGRLGHHGNDDIVIDY